MVRYLKRIVSLVFWLVASLVVVLAFGFATSKELNFTCQDKDGSSDYVHFESGNLHYWLLKAMSGIDSFSTETDMEYEIMTVVPPTPHDPAQVMIDVHISKADGHSHKVITIEGDRPTYMVHDGSCKMPPDND